MCNENNDCKCISEILTVICILQHNADCCGDECLDTCDKGFLGNTATCLSCNTRPIMLYTCCGNGVAWSMPISKGIGDTSIEQGPTTNVFRVEKVDGCCATFRCLTTSRDGCSHYEATNSFFTMNLNCICCLRCLNDTCVECL